MTARGTAATQCGAGCINTTSEAGAAYRHLIGSRRLLNWELGPVSSLDTTVKHFGNRPSFLSATVGEGQPCDLFKDVS
jgi:hypothetical protein